MSVKRNPRVYSGSIKNGDNDLSDVRKTMREIRDTMQMVSEQTADNTSQIKRSREEFNRQMKASRAEHDREMKEIRSLFKQMIKRLAV